MLSMSTGWLHHHSSLMEVLLKVVRTDDDDLVNANGSRDHQTTKYKYLKLRIMMIM